MDQAKPGRSSRGLCSWSPRQQLLIDYDNSPTAHSPRNWARAAAAAAAVAAAATAAAGGCEVAAPLPAMAPGPPGPAKGCPVVPAVQAQCVTPEMLPQPALWPPYTGVTIICRWLRPPRACVTQLRVQASMPEMPFSRWTPVQLGSPTCRACCCWRRAAAISSSRWAWICSGVAGGRRPGSAGDPACSRE